MQRSREEVETILTSDLKLALERFESANSALLDQTLVGALETWRLQQAQQAKASAAIDLRRALRRHNRFILDREVPEDLDPQAARAHGASK